MNAIQILKLIKEVLSDTSIVQTSPDDPSGCNSTYVVDHEQLMHNIEHKLEQLEKENR